MEKSNTKHVRHIRGAWFLDYRDPRLGGKRIIRKVGTSKHEAEIAMSAVLTDITRNQYNIPPAKQMLFSEFAKLYMEKYSRPNKRSWRRDEVSLVSLLRYFGEKTMDKILPFAIEGYKAERIQKVKPATCNRELSCLRHMMTMAVNWQLAWSNPMKDKGVKHFREDNQQTRFLTREEEGRLLQACPDSLLPIVQTALLTGMRLGEILALEWAQVDLSKSPGVITVVRSKSGKSRQIPVCRSLAAILSRLKQRATSEHVFVSGRTGRPYKSIRTAWEAARKRSGIAPCTFHSLRHTYGTYLSDQGLPLPALKNLMGHSTILVTSRYAHGTPRAEQEAVAHLETMLPDEKYGKKMERMQEEDKNINAVSLG